MCKYCGSDIEKEPIKEVISTDGYLIECAAIINPSPISIRKNPENPAILQVAFFSDTIDIPIKYCPMCGKEIK